MGVRGPWSRLCVLALASTSLATAPAEPPLLESVAPMPAHQLAPVWIEALESSGLRVSDEFETRIQTLHPYEVGAWSQSVYAAVDGLGGPIHLTGTVVVEAVGPAEARLRMEPSGTIGTPERVAWRLLVKRARKKASAELAGRATTPAAVQAQVTEALTDPLACVAHVATLARVDTPQTMTVVAQAMGEIAATCQPSAIAFLARSTGDPALWSPWFRRAWNGAAPAQQASLVDVLESTDSVPPDLAVLRDYLRQQAAAERRAAEAAERLRASGPLQCADGTIDRVCQCGDPHHTCCVYHGGVGRCLPPPPQ